jgi:hypothetical protein
VQAPEIVASLSDTELEQIIDQEIRVLDGCRNSPIPPTMIEGVRSRLIRYFSSPEYAAQHSDRMGISIAVREAITQYRTALLLWSG